MYFSKVNLQRKAEFLVILVLEILPLTLKLQSSSVRQRAGLGTLGCGLPLCVAFVSVSQNSAQAALRSLSHQRNREILMSR